VAAISTAPLIDVNDVSRAYGPTLAVDRLSLTVEPREIHAVLGRNGAGKTTVLRMLSGLVEPTTGVVRIAGIEVGRDVRQVSSLVGLVPSGDRSFYLRLSALENLLFFGRLHGLRKHDARRRAREVLAEVGLADVASRPMSTYSHGMQKRASVARALLTDPPVLLVDEATHDLDPDGASVVRTLVRRAADSGAAVLWATQRVEEVRGFADRVTLLERGRAWFAGTVTELLARAGARRFVVVLGPNGRGEPPPSARLADALRGLGHIRPIHAGDGAHLLALSEGATLGDALGALLATGVTVLGCRHERPEVEEAFLQILGPTGGGEG
jgi:ABC-type multidrug transport system ATPase subunit